MLEALSVPTGLSLWLDVTFGILLAVALTVTADLLARYAAQPARRSQSHTLQKPTPSGGSVSSAQLFSHP
jgi:hypothetical protein